MSVGRQRNYPHKNKRSRIAGPKPIYIRISHPPNIWSSTYLLRLLWRRNWRCRGICAWRRVINAQIDHICSTKNDVFIYMVVWRHLILWMTCSCASSLGTPRTHYVSPFETPKTYLSAAKERLALHQCSTEHPDTAHSSVK